MLNLSLKVAWPTLHKQLAQQLELGQTLQKTKITTEEELEELATSRKNWERETLAVLGSSFSAERNAFWNDFNQAGYNRVSLNVKLPLESLANRETTLIREKVNELHVIIRTLGVCDALVRPDEIETELRARLDIQNTLELLVDKLYQLWGDSFAYPLRYILMGNGIPMVGYDYDLQLAEVLSDADYIDYQHHSHQVYAQLTLRGAHKYEEAVKAAQMDYEQLSEDKGELARHFDELKDWLEDYSQLSQAGQEVIYNELQEVTDAAGTISKKGLGRMIAGTLKDLVTAKVANTEVVNKVWELLIGS